MQDMTLAAALQLIFLAGVSLAIGSFVATLALRVPEGQTILGRSHCRSCGAGLGSRDLVPVLSWLALKGKCRMCGAPIAAYYPLVELVSLGLGLWAASVLDGWVLWASCGFAWALLALSLIDLEHMLLPNTLTLPLIPAGIAVVALAAPGSLFDSVLGAALGYGFFEAVAWLYRHLRKREGLGGGDAKLLGALGAWVGATGLPSVVLVGALLALAGTLVLRVLRGRTLTDRVPFGPALALAGWIVWLYGPLVLAR